MLTYNVPSPVLIFFLQRRFVCLDVSFMPDSLAHINMNRPLKVLTVMKEARHVSIQVILSQVTRFVPHLT